MSALLETYHYYPITLTHGKGSYVWDDTDKKYLDFYGGHAVCIAGHCPDQVVDAIKQQSEKLIFFSNIVHKESTEQLATMLAASYNNLYSVYLSNSGSEANEAALKIARKYTGKNHIISFKNSFHGRGITSLSVTGIESYHQFEPNLLEHTSFATFGDIESVKNCLKPETAAVICEPIQSIGGINIAPPSFFQELKKWCEEKNILLIFDEIQTGLHRTGPFWYAQKVGIIPDIITSAKGIASGLPIGSTLVHEKIAGSIAVGEHACTFGGGPVVCSAAIETLKIIQSAHNAEKNKDTIIQALKDNPHIQEIKGEGLLLGITTPFDGKELVKQALHNGLIIGTSKDNHTIRIMPPLTITDSEISEFAEKFSKSVDELKKPSADKSYYLNKFAGKTFVIKVGGEVIANTETLEKILTDIKALWEAGIKIVLVHGGGPQADQLSKDLGHKPTKINGRRVTQEKDLEICKMLFGGSLNLEILRILQKLGVKGMRVSGLDGNLLDVSLRTDETHDYGFVGDIHQVNTQVINDLLTHQYLPVISPLAADEHGTIVNINADTIATDTAIALKADKLIIFTNIEGVLINNEKQSVLTIENAEYAIKNHDIYGGMAVKVENCIHALKNNVTRVHIVNGLSTHSLLKEVLSKEGTGTMLVSAHEAQTYTQEKSS